MPFSELIDAELDRFRTTLLAAIEAGQQQKSAELEALRLELTREYEERAQLNEQYQALRQELEAIRLRQVEAEIELESLRSERTAREEAEKAGAALQSRLAELEKRLKDTHDQLKLEAEASTKLTLELVDVKIEKNAEIRSLLENTPKVTAGVLLPERTEDPASQLVQKLAYEDRVTGLPNHHLGERFLQIELNKAGKQGCVALVILRIDHLQDLRELLGEESVEELVGLFAERIQQCLHQEDVLTRGQNEEFWVIMPSHGGGPIGLKSLCDTVTRTVAGLFEALKTPFHTDQHKVQMAVAGGYFASLGQESALEVVERAGLALQTAAAKGGNRLVQFQPELEKPQRKRARQAPQLREALFSNQFELRFQPIVELKTNIIKGVETLIRWNHPEDGVLEPADFLDAACRSGLIVGIGDWVINRVCDLSKDFRHVYWSINVSAQELMQADYVKRFTKALQNAKVGRPEFLVVEVAEHHLATNNRRLIAALKELRGWQVQLAIDDFSFDSVSMRRLQARGVNYIKLSHDVTHNMDQKLNRNLVHGAVLAADAMGAKVVAKGIENQGQLDFLMEQGCHWGQGHRLCSPLSWVDLEPKLQIRSTRR